MPWIVGRFFEQNKATEEFINELLAIALLDFVADSPIDRGLQMHLGTCTPSEAGVRLWIS